MPTFFDYIYYRLYRKYYKYDGKAASRAVIFLAGTITLFAGEISIMTLKMFASDFLKRNSQSITNWVLFGIGLPLLFYIQKNYEGRYRAFYYRFSDESYTNRKLRGWLVFLFLISPWLLLYFLTKL